MSRMLIVLFSLLAACSSDPASVSGNPGDTGGGPIPCVGTYGGAASGAFECVVSATSDPLASLVSVSFTVSNLTGTALDLDIVDFSWSGAVTDGTRSEATAGVSFLAMVTGGTVASPVAYIAVKGKNGFTDAGTSTLTLTSHALTASDAYSEEYAVHGAYAGTLPAWPASGADPVTVSVTF